MRLLRGLEQIQHIPLDIGSPIVHTSSADPYVALLSEDGQVILLTLRESRGQGRLSVFKPNISAVRIRKFILVGRIFLRMNKIINYSFAESSSFENMCLSGRKRFVHTDNGGRTSKRYVQIRFKKYEKVGILYSFSILKMLMIKAFVFYL